MLTELRGGLFVRNDAMALALDLERRGHVLSVKDGVLYCARGTELSVADRAAIRSMRTHLLAIAGYEERV